MASKRYKIVYEDEHLIIVDKPSGMLVIPSPKKEKDTLTDLLCAELKARGEAALAHPCHRLDRETSGLVVYAKGKKAQHLMMEKFRLREVKKGYIAFAHGVIEKGFDTIERAIYNRNKDRVEKAVTKYKVLQIGRDFTVVDVEPVTGRTNQIRIHFKEIGHPLVGESLFAFRKDFALKFRRVALHARYLGFDHPITGIRIEANAEMPEDMDRFLKERQG